MKNYEIRKGHKKIYGVETAPGVVRVMVDCDVVGQCGMVDFNITVAQAEEVFNDRRRNIQEVLPDVPAAVREVFISGTTPLEWAELFGKLPGVAVDSPPAIAQMREIFRPYRAFYSFDEGCAPEWATDAPAVPAGWASVEA